MAELSQGGIPLAEGCCVLLNSPPSRPSSIKLCITSSLGALVGAYMRLDRGLILTRSGRPLLGGTCYVFFLPHDADRLFASNKSLRYNHFPHAAHSNVYKPRLRNRWRAGVPCTGTKPPVCGMYRRHAAARPRIHGHGPGRLYTNSASPAQSPTKLLTCFRIP